MSRRQFEPLPNFLPGLRETERHRKSGMIEVPQVEVAVFCECGCTVNIHRPFEYQSAGESDHEHD